MNALTIINNTYFLWSACVIMLLVIIALSRAMIKTNSENTEGKIKSLSVDLDIARNSLEQSKSDSKQLQVKYEQLLAEHDSLVTERDSLLVAKPSKISRKPKKVSKKRVNYAVEIPKYVAENPGLSQREVARHFGCSPNTASAHMKAKTPKPSPGPGPEIQANLAFAGAS